MSNESDLQGAGALHRARVFCCGETGDDCVSGHLDTMLPLQEGHIHTIKGRKWRCDWVGENDSGEPLANFRPAT